MQKISIIVCTVNRADFLSGCLLSILYQSTNENKPEIIVVDNCSTYNTNAVVLEPRFEMLEYFFEVKVGLSHARNRGAKEAKGEWLCYIDDDARLHPGYIERALWVIENYNFDCFGGMYYAWYPFGKPKWIDNDFGTKISLRDTVGPIDVPELSGGNFLIKKEVFEKAGGFPVDYGMAGERIGYGEEDFLQRRLLEIGYKLGFDPELKIDHAVLKHKLKLGWHLKSKFAQGRDGEFLQKKSFPFALLLFFRSMIGVLLKRFPYCTIRLIFNQQYYLQNYIFDLLSPIAVRLGQIAFYLK